jgi:mxaK protein
MGLTSSRRTRWAIGLLGLVLAATLVDGANLWRHARWNTLIAEQQPVPHEGNVPELRFAEAHALAASGNAETALNRYRELQGDTPLGQAARFNSANLLMRQAIEVRGSAQPGQAIALIELAKETLREVLRHDPQHWDARYNLERAQRLLPDPEEVEIEPPDAARERERAATTMRGQSAGLP